MTEPIDHSRGLCQRPDIPADTPRVVAMGRAKCMCCGTVMIDEDCDSVAMNMLGMYWLRCPTCPSNGEAAR